MNTNGLIILINITTGTAQVALIRERNLCFNIEVIVIQKREKYFLFRFDMSAGSLRRAAKTDTPAA